jgi:hypothetical protein
MPEIIIMGLSGDSKVLPMTATKTEIVDAILKTATKQYKIMVSETNYTAYYVEAQSPDEAQQIWADNRAYEGFDEFYSYKDKWDINIHAVGQKQRTIYAVAYPQTVDEDGYLSTVTSCWVEIGQYDMNGTPRRKGTAQ